MELQNLRLNMWQHKLNQFHHMARGQQLMELCDSSYTTVIKNLGVQSGSNVNIAQARDGSGGIIVCDGYNTGNISFYQLV